MNRVEFVKATKERVNEKLGQKFKVDEIDAILHEANNVKMNALLKEGMVKDGFATYEVKSTESRLVRNPKNPTETWMSEPSKKIVIKACPEAKRVVKGK